MSRPDFLSNLPYNSTWDRRILESFKVAEETCTAPDILFLAARLPTIGIHFRDLMVILSAVAMIFSCLVTTYLICGHFFHWVRPAEQKHIAVCILYLPVFTVTNFFAGWFYHGYNYLIPVLQLYNAKSLTAVFLLYVAYVCPEESLRDEFHAGLERRWLNGKKRHNRGSLRWYRIIHVLVFQIVPFQIILFPFYYIILGTSCPLAKSRETTTTVLQVFQFLTSGISWNATWVYHKRVYKQLPRRRLNWQLNAFQTLVGLQNLQQLLFPLLAAHEVFFPTQYVSFMDFSRVLPAFILCWEALICSLFFLHTFSFTPYRTAVLAEGLKPKGPGQALLDTLDQGDFLRGTWLMFRIVLGRGRSGNEISQERIERSRVDGDALDLPTVVPARSAQVEDMLETFNSK